MSHQPAQASAIAELRKRALNNVIARHFVELERMYGTTEALAATLVAAINENDELREMLLHRAMNSGAQPVIAHREKRGGVTWLRTAK